MYKRVTGMTLLVLVVLLALCALPATADSVVKEAGDAVVNGVELSLLSGTTGWGAGAFWPLAKVEEINAEIGPFLAFGNQLVASGAGAKFAAKIPYMEKYIDFVAIGGAYKHSDVTFEAWVGKTIPIDK